MATPLPEPFKTADISRYALRAAQLEKHKPVISYWCMRSSFPPPRPARMVPALGCSTSSISKTDMP